MKRKVFGVIALLMVLSVLASCVAVNGEKPCCSANAGKAQPETLHLRENTTVEPISMASEEPSREVPEAPERASHDEAEAVPEVLVPPEAPESIARDETEAAPEMPAPITENRSVDPCAANNARQTDNVTEEDVYPETMEGALFIGDSRTVGLAEYANLDGAHFFASVGMSVYNVWEAEVSVPTVGKVSLKELLKHGQYGKIYIMLGINELGCNRSRTLTKYGDLVSSVRLMQPQACVILMANLHVTRTRSEKDKYINNPAIDRFNDETSAFADNETVFFLDANGLFDDADGNLSEEKSADNAHLKAKYCREWGNWIAIRTGEVLNKVEGESVC